MRSAEITKQAVCPEYECRTVVASTYVLMGGCVGLAGCIAASQLSSAQANLDPGIIFDVLTIVVVGGTSLSGGSGAMWRTAVGLGHHCDDLERLRAARHQSVLSVDHQGLDHRRGAGARYWTDPSGAG